MTVDPDISVAIVGAGIVGTALAFRLAEAGYHVTLFDPGAPGELGPSYGNAGHIAGSDIFPLSSPGIVLKGLGMLLKADGPLKIAPSHLPALLPWLLKFLRAGRGEAFETATLAISTLCDGAVSATERLFTDAGIASMFRRVPALYVYGSASSMAASRAGWARKAAAGHASREIGKAELTSLEPDLAKRFAGGILSFDWAEVSEPLDVVRGLFAAARSKGTIFRQARVERIAAAEAGGIQVEAGGERLRFDRVVIAAGVWSGRLAASLGETLPVEAEGGYNITFAQPSIRVNHPIVFPDHGVVSTSLTSGLRIGGWAEYAGLDAAANLRYFERMERIGQGFFPGLDAGRGVRWSGRRPSMPDSTPVLSRSTRNRDIFYATGHGHYGLSWAARSADIMLSLVAGDDGIAQPFSIRRFNGRAA
jgi:D-amino-acid dehydrogenase